jgi:hypothetical protein
MKKVVIHSGQYSQLVSLCRRAWIESDPRHHLQWHISMQGEILRQSYGRLSHSLRQDQSRHTLEF